MTVANVTSIHKYTVRCTRRLLFGVFVLFCFLFICFQFNISMQTSYSYFLRIHNQLMISWYFSFSLYQAVVPEHFKGKQRFAIFFHWCMRKYQSLTYQHIRARELLSNPFYKGICILLARPFPTAPAERSIHLPNTPFWKTCKRREPLKFKWKIVYGISEWKLFARFLSIQNLYWQVLFI